MAFLFNYVKRFAYGLIGSYRLRNGKMSKFSFGVLSSYWLQFTGIFYLWFEFLKSQKDTDLGPDFTNQDVSANLTTIHTNPWSIIFFDADDHVVLGTKVYDQNVWNNKNLIDRFFTSVGFSFEYLVLSFTQLASQGLVKLFTSFWFLSLLLILFVFSQLFGFGHKIKKGFRGK